MKQLACIVLFVLYINLLYAQRSMIPNKHSNKKEMFGVVDLNEYRPFGLQLSFGLTGTIPTRNTPIENRHNLMGRPPYNFTTDPSGRIGVFAELGLIHYPKKRSKLSQKLNYIFISYIDWGIGIKTYHGKETTNVELLSSADFSTLKTDELSGTFRHLTASARIAIHKNFYIRKKYFIDNGLGLNVDLRINKNTQSDYTQEIENIIAEHHTFQRSPSLYVHYELGFGFRLSRRSLLVPAVQFPIVGLHPWRQAASDFKWFDSNYYPIVAKIKWTYLFGVNTDKKCPPVFTNEQDKDTMKKQ